jgi:acetyl esterase
MARSFVDFLERKALLALMSLPHQRLFDPITVDGLKLDPEIQMYLWIRKVMKKPAMGDLPPSLSRKAYVKDSLVHGIDIDHISSQDFLIKDGLYGRLYSKSDDLGPAIIYFHGGGFVIGDNQMFDHVMRYICAESGYKIFAVDYRKAPEFPFPHPIEDGVAGYKWAIENALRLKIDVDRLAVAGDSAGGNIATVVTQIICNEDFLRPKKQLLFYPTCDWVDHYPSTDLFGTGFFLTIKDFEYFSDHYHGGRLGDYSDFRISPLRGRLKGLPPAIIVTAGFDPLRDQGDAYAKAMKAAGVDVVHYREEGMIHAFVNLVGFSQHARDAVTKAISLLKL